MADHDFYRAAERRIEYFTIVVGIAGGCGAGLRWGYRAGAGVGAGALISWLNYRWLKSGIVKVASFARTQQGAEKISVPRGIYFKFVAQYALLILAAYVILNYFELPVASLLAGFGSVVAAVLAEATGQLFRRKSIPRADN